MNFDIISFTPRYLILKRGTILLTIEFLIVTLGFYKISFWSTEYQKVDEIFSDSIKNNTISLDIVGHMLSNPNAITSKNLTDLKNRVTSSSESLIKYLGKQYPKCTGQIDVTVQKNNIMLRGTAPSTYSIHSGNPAGSLIDHERNRNYLVANNHKCETNKETVGYGEIVAKGVIYGDIIEKIIIPILLLIVFYFKILEHKISSQYPYKRRDKNTPHYLD